jgi:hypothetical protein
MFYFGIQISINIVETTVCLQHVLYNEHDENLEFDISKQGSRDDFLSYDIESAKKKVHLLNLHIKTIKFLFYNYFYRDFWFHVLSMQMSTYTLRSIF